MRNNIRSEIHIHIYGQIIIYLRFPGVWPNICLAAQNSGNQFYVRHDPIWRQMLRSYSQHMYPKYPFPNQNRKHLKALAVNVIKQLTAFNATKNFQSTIMCSTIFFYVTMAIFEAKKHFFIFSTTNSSSLRKMYQKCWAENCSK